MTFELHKDPADPDFLKLKPKIEELKRKKQARKQKRKEELQQHVVSETERITAALAEIETRGIVMGKPMFNTQQQYEGKVYVDENKVLHWPVMFLYEEHNQSDFVKDFSEEQTFLDHLSYMFSEGTILPWDKEQKYKLSNLEIYVELGTVTPMKPTTRLYNKRWLKVKQTTTLKKLLTHPDYVVPAFPVVYILVNPSTFRKEFLKKKFD